MTTNKLRKSNPCVHHYILPEPSGQNAVTGVCKKCGDEKEHELVIPHHVWNSWRGDPTKAKKPSPMTAGEAIKNRRKIKARSVAKSRQKGTNGTHTTARHD